MSRYQVIARMPYASGLPADVSINTWAFESNSAEPTEAEMDDIGTALFLFYSALVGFYGEMMANQIQFLFYDIDAPPPRTPLAVGPLTSISLAGGGTPLPEETAVALSFNGVFASGSPSARRRGRVFLGPLENTAVSYNTSINRVVVSPSFRGVVAAGVDDMVDSLDGTGIIHSVWSRSDDQLYNVIQYTMDDAPDTQRRRGQEPSQRYVLYPPPP